jgi:hypothetical protein
MFIRLNRFEDFKEAIITCDCGDLVNHILYINEDDDGFISLNLALNHFLPWYKRVVVACKYVLGLDNTYFHYVELVIRKDSEDVKQLMEFLNE